MRGERDRGEGGDVDRSIRQADGRGSSRHRWQERHLVSVRQALIPAGIRTVASRAHVWPMGSQRRSALHQRDPGIGQVSIIRQVELGPFPGELAQRGKAARHDSHQTGTPVR